MSTRKFAEGSQRPYVNRQEFDRMYPISYEPDIGIIDNSTGRPISLSLPIISRTASGKSGIGIGTTATRSIMRPLVSNPSLRYKKNIYSDLEFKEYFDSANMKQLLSSLLHSFLSNYSRLLFSQPFEISKILLQVGSFTQGSLKKHHYSSQDKTASSGSTSDANVAIDSDSESEDASMYFKQVDETDDLTDTSKASVSNLRESQIERSPRVEKLGLGTTKGKTHLKKRSKATRGCLIEPESLNIMDIVSGLIAKEGPRGIFKAVNTSFLMNTFQYTIQSWISGFVSGLLNIPDPLFVDISHSPNANLSLGLSVLSHVVTSMILSQIALIRMRFIVTTSTKGMRSFREIVGKLPRFSLFKIPRDLIIPNFITSLVRAFSQHYPEYLVSSILHISKYNSPYLYSTINLLLKILGLFIKLPFETLYSRAQVNCLIHSEHIPSVMRISEGDMCVKFGGYQGYLSTLYYIMSGTKAIDYGKENNLESSISIEVDNSEELNKGPLAIFRGWRLGLVQILSRFTLNLLANEADETSLSEEQL